MARWARSAAIAPAAAPGLKGSETIPAALFKKSRRGPIVGARDPAQIAGTAGAADVKLTAGDLAQIDAIMKDAAPLVGPSPEAMPA